jgi:PBP1b-binding outer membrane lipoprotein LpoB
VKLPALLSLAAAAAFLAACSSSPAISSSQPPAAPQPTTPVATTAAASPTTAAKVVDGNITITPAAGMAPGPMKIIPVYCGKFSQAQQDEYQTNATAGFVYKYSNASNTLTAAAEAFVSFTDGTTVTGANNAGADWPMIGPGQNAVGEVDAPASFTGCELTSYVLVTSAGVDPVSYAG